MFLPLYEAWVQLVPKWSPPVNHQSLLRSRDLCTSTKDCMTPQESFWSSLTISADVLKTGSLLDRELLKILKRDISRAPLARDHFQRVIRCVGEWVLSSVFSVFCIRSCSACTFLQLRKTTSFLGKKGTSPLCLEKNMKEKSIKNLLRKRQTHFFSWFLGRNLTM